MEFFETVKKRQSIRAYEKKDIGPTILKKILEAANSAPSAGDIQAYEIVTVRDQRQKRALAAAALGQSFIAEAPVVLVFCANPARSANKYGERGEQLYCVQDATIAAAYAQLAAAALGLGACWVGAFDERAVAEVIKAPPGIRPVALMPIGWPAEKPWRTPRRSLTELVHEEKI